MKIKNEICIGFILILLPLINSNDNIRSESVAKPTSTSYLNVQFSKFIEAFSTVFLSGLFDRSFFVTAVMATKYAKLTVLLAAGIALSLIGIISIFVGVAVNKVLPIFWINVLSVVLFLVFGGKMIYDGFQIKDQKEAMVLHGNDTEDEENNALVQGKVQPPKAKSEWTTFLKIFSIVFAAEIGDRSQISTIFLTNNFDKTIVLSAVVLGQNILTVIAMFSGVFFSKSLSTKVLTIAAGCIFIGFGLFALILIQPYHKV